MINIMYGIYLALSITLTVWVAHTLHKNGRIFLVDVFDGDEAMATSVNHLLVVGFYLVNLGFVSLMLKSGTNVGTGQECIETLAAKMGQVSLTLGGMHFLNLFIFSKIRGRSSYPQFVTNAAPPRCHMPR
jgi:hypothetical protein